MGFSENLKTMLELNNVEVKELANGTGISKNTLDNYLSGQKSLPNAENAVKIASFLRTSVEYLVTGTNEFQQNENDEFIAFLSDVYKLKKADFLSIKNIVKSLAKVK